MRPLLLCLIASGLVAGCSCSETGIEGRPDSNDDPGVDMVEDDSPVPCPDRDGDGYLDLACGGDDCDDWDPDVYPGANEVCLDGVDQDCDGIVDGPMLLGEALQLSSNPTVGTITDTSNIVWTGSEFLLAWREWLARDPLVGEVYFGGVDATGMTSEIRDGSSYRVARARLMWTGSVLGVVGAWNMDPPMLSLWISSTAGEVIAGPETLTEESGGTGLWTGSAFNAYWFRTLDYPSYQSEIFQERFNDHGERLSETLSLSFTEPITGLMEPPEVAWTGSKVGMVWAEDRMRGSVYFTLADELPDALLSRARISSPGDRAWFPDLKWTGTEFGVAWGNLSEDRLRILFASVSEDGTLTTGPTVVEEGGFIPRIAWTGSEFAIASGVEGGDRDLLSIRMVDHEGTVKPGAVQVMKEHPNLAQAMEITWTGSELGFIWADARDDCFQVFFQRIGLCD